MVVRLNRSTVEKRSKRLVRTIKILILWCGKWIISEIIDIDCFRPREYYTLKWDRGKAAENETLVVQRSHAIFRRHMIVVSSTRECQRFETHPAFYTSWKYYPIYALQKIIQSTCSTRVNVTTNIVLLCKFILENVAVFFIVFYLNWN